MPSRGLGSTCTRCQERKVRCSLACGRAKRRLEEELGGSALKRLKRGEDARRDPSLEERKVQALKAIAFGLDRVTSVLERVEEEARILGDLSALRAFKEVSFPLGEWDQRERFAEFVINQSDRWVQDKLEGKSVEGSL